MPTHRLVQPGVETKKTYCRFCHNYCAMEVDVLDGKPIAVRGDTSDPVYGGYTCLKGRQLVAAYDHESRITRPLKKLADGSWQEISSKQALDEIAEKVKKIIAAEGPRSIATYCGTYSFQESAALALSRAFHEGIKSPSYYTSVSIDQPAKGIALSRFGVWAGGPHSFEGADVALIVGCNTLISHFAPYGGIPPFSPRQALNKGLKDGIKMIVIDPRKTEVSRKAHIHLQVRPGEDPTVLCGMIKVILDEDLYDAEFCEQFVDGLQSLREAVSDFTPEYVELRAGVPAELMIEAARVWGHGKRGTATAGTGPNMAPRGNVMEHLLHVLNTLCSRFNKEGDKVPNPGVLSPMGNRKAEVIAPWAAYGKDFPQSRIRGLSECCGEMPTAALNDEILKPGEGQIKVLFNIGGNPIVAFPNQHKTVRAMDALELLVCIDVRMSATAVMADYILPGKICLERDDAPVMADTWFDVPYTHYAEAIVEPNGDLIEEWEFYWELAHRLGIELTLGGSILPMDAAFGVATGGQIPMDHKPTKFEVLTLVTSGTKISLEEIRAKKGGFVFDSIECVVEKGDSAAKLQLTPPGISDEIREIRAERLSASGIPEKDGDYSHLLTSRRLNHVYNSSGQQFDAVKEKGTTNCAYMHPDDLSALSVKSGDLIQISGPGGIVTAVTEAESTIKRGVCSLAHGWGFNPEYNDDDDVREMGASSNRIISDEAEYDPISGMARQSAIPVQITAV
ncbi:molybdopterin-dependent oxidoreductase [Luminiphilus sp.]|nr:molybdopterin-dependent oxidoreductase [Luminiphilus sp.]